MSLPAPWPCIYSQYFSCRLLRYALATSLFEGHACECLCAFALVAAAALQAVLVADLAANLQVA
jgi:hypothetical protein